MFESVTFDPKRKFNFISQEPFYKDLVDGLMAHPLTQGGVGKQSLLSTSTPYGTDRVLQVETVTTPPYTDDLGNGNQGGVGNAKFRIPGNKKYRFCLWVRRISTATTYSGAIYLGPNRDTASPKVVLTSSGVDSGNPYFVTIELTQLPVNEWVLLVGILHPQGTISATVESAIYRLNGTKMTVGTYRDFSLKAADPTEIYLRSFLHYGSILGAKVQFYHPRMEELKSNSPTIAQLLSGKRR